MHIYKTEQLMFKPYIGQLVPVFYGRTAQNSIDVSQVESISRKSKIKVLCVENTHNYRGGMVTQISDLNELCSLAHHHSIHVHVDGARIFKNER